MRERHSVPRACSTLQLCSLVRLYALATSHHLPEHIIILNRKSQVVRLFIVDEFKLQSRFLASATRLGVASKCILVRKLAAARSPSIKVARHCEPWYGASRRMNLEGGHYMSDRHEAPLGNESPANGVSGWVVL